MRENIKAPRKLAARADKIWQSASNRSVNVVSTVSSPGQVPDQVALNALHQHPPPRPAPHAAPSSTCPPALASSQNTDLCWYHRTLVPPTGIKLSVAVLLAPGQQEVHPHPAEESNLVFLVFLACLVFLVFTVFTVFLVFRTSFLLHSLLFVVLI